MPDDIRPQTKSSAKADLLGGKNMIIEGKRSNQTVSALSKFGDAQMEIFVRVGGRFCIWCKYSAAANKQRSSRCGHWRWHCAGWLVIDRASERGGGGGGGRCEEPVFSEVSERSSSTGPSVLSSLASWSDRTAAPPGRGRTRSVRSLTGCSSWRAMSSPARPGLRSPLLAPPTGQRGRLPIGCKVIQLLAVSLLGWKCLSERWSVRRADTEITTTEWILLVSPASCHCGFKWNY